MQIAIFTTGGTIDKVYFDAKGNYHVGAPMVRELLVARAAERDSRDHRAAPQGQSGDGRCRPADRSVRPCEACAAPRILVTHGTDTMVATALALKGIADKTIVLTGALQPGRFADSDAAFNLGLAYGAVQLCSAGVYVVANGTVFPADKVRKNLELNRFEPL